MGAPMVPVGPVGSPFQVNKTVVVSVVAVSAVVLVLGLVLLTRPSTTVNTSKSGAAGAGSTVPAIGDLQLGSPTTVAPTTSTTAFACDSKTSSHSVNGLDYRPCGSGFEIDFPGIPEITTRSDELPTGTVRWTLMVSTQPDQDYRGYTKFAAMWGELSGEPSPDDLKAAMEAAAYQFAAKPGVDTAFHDLPAMDFAGADGLNTTKGIVFVNGKKVIVLATSSTSPNRGNLLDALKETFAFV